jgi:hypothetical protein
MREWSHSTRRTGRGRRVIPGYSVPYIWEEGPPQLGGSNETTLNLLKSVAQAILVQFLDWVSRHALTSVVPPARSITAAMARTGRMGGARTGAATFRSSAASAFRSLSVPGLLQVGELPQMMTAYRWRTRRWSSHSRSCRPLG